MPSKVELVEKGGTEKKFLGEGIEERGDGERLKLGQD